VNALPVFNNSSASGIVPVPNHPVEVVNQSKHDSKDHSPKSSTKHTEE